jgi:Enoyl-CoA hydratase/isomerase
VGIAPSAKSRCALHAAPRAWPRCRTFVNWPQGHWPQGQGAFTRDGSFTGAGDRAFSAGADIHEFSASVRRGTTTAVRDFVRRGQGMTARLEAFGKPVIAAVNGIGKPPAICAPGGRRRSFPRKI